MQLPNIAVFRPLHTHFICCDYNLLVHLSRVVKAGSKFVPAGTEPGTRRHFLSTQYTAVVRLLAAMSGMEMVGVVRVL